MQQEANRNLFQQRKLQTDTQQISVLQRVSRMLIFTHPGETRNTLRSQYEFLCFYVCISFPPEEVVPKPCVYVHFFRSVFLKTDCDLCCVTKYFNCTTEFQLRVVLACLIGCDCLFPVRIFSDTCSTPHSLSLKCCLLGGEYLSMDVGVLFIYYYFFYQ